MNKFDKIESVRSLGLNSENSYLMTANDSDLDVPDKFSLRTQWKDATNKSKTEHYPVITKQKFLKIKDELLGRGLELIVGDLIDPQDCEFAGCIMKDKDIYNVELAEGPGTVRRVTHDGDIDISHYGITTTADARINEFLRDLKSLDRKDFLKDVCNFEISYYNKPIGTRNQNRIYWEYYDV